MLRRAIIKKYNLRFDEKMQMAGDCAFYLNMLEHGDLAIFYKEGAIVRAHPESAAFKQKLSPVPLKELVDITGRYLQDFFNESERRILVENIAGRVWGYAPSGIFEDIGKSRCHVSSRDWVAYRS
jgi:hypothetical protein